ncbi:hypothetical protein VNO77_02306 [Canavalia gladiata]|uniref:Secreted protein n=1 Tax=Canavalia gladiata TaxID=3824 RepID=A0AAN9R601_CANGL
MSELVRVWLPAAFLVGLALMTLGEANTAVARSWSSVHEGARRLCSSALSTLCVRVPPIKADILMEWAFRLQRDHSDLRRSQSALRTTSPAFGLRLARSPRPLFHSASDRLPQAPPRIRIALRRALVHRRCLPACRSAFRRELHPLNFNIALTPEVRAIHSPYFAC